ncbi:hypothetical protein Gxy13693_063_004 [Komagataeibacter xylinus NBRC 13693]|uniref:Uncharacterized protein n=1 Tax=Komagataeibacter xylinus NBRC 13693 TaxID=1234668 RepID=A0A0D6QBJ4_KOMXY|nr:hypothetical protein Gxy13693_063_004 [Komagataeibacter xylinus NBRC 13693]
MAMPEAAMDENYGPVFWKYQIRRTRQLSIMQSEAETKGMQAFSQDHFRLRVFPADTSHHPAPLFG